MLITTLLCSCNLLMNVIYDDFKKKIILICVLQILNNYKYIWFEYFFNRGIE